MNVIFLLLEIIISFGLMILFYRFEKKDGLFMCIGLFSAIYSIIMFKTIDIFSFQVNLGIPILISIFLLSNVIIHRYGLDEIKRIIIVFGIFYITPVIIISLLSFLNNSNYNLVSNMAFNELFGYNFNSVRLFIASVISIPLMIWINSEVYYVIRKSRNSLILSNIFSMLFIQFIGSLIFILISYIGTYDSLLIFGMIVIRYLLMICIGIVGLIPVSMLVKMKDK